MGTSSIFTLFTFLYEKTCSPTGIIWIKLVVVTAVCYNPGKIARQKSIQKNYTKVFF